jgi:hypothetical protein
MTVLTPDQEPEDRYCDSGHVAPATFRRGGSGTPALPTRFIRVGGKVYCEPCVAVANYIAAQKRKKRKEAQRADD